MAYNKVRWFRLFPLDRHRLPPVRTNFHCVTPQSFTFLILTAPSCRSPWNPSLRHTNHPEDGHQLISNFIFSYSSLILPAVWNFYIFPHQIIFFFCKIPQVIYNPLQETLSKVPRDAKGESHSQRNPAIRTGLSSLDSITWLCWKPVVPERGRENNKTETERDRYNEEAEKETGRKHI